MRRSHGLEEGVGRQIEDAFGNKLRFSKKES
jgi:hypothetical protein